MRVLVIGATGAIGTRLVPRLAARGHEVRRRHYPIPGDGRELTSLIHLDAAAAATVLALEHDGAGLYNIVDDEPAPMREWLPAMASALGAGPPRRVPAWLATLVAGRDMVAMSTQARGASNAKAKAELGWTLRYPTWREGFPASYRQPEPLQAAA